MLKFLTGKERRLALSGSKGFTLIELLVVIAIVALLASVVMLYLRSPKLEARNARRQLDIQEIYKAMALAYSDDDQYPNIEVDGDNKISGIDGAGNYSIKTYLEVPEDPNGGQYFAAANVSDRQKYCIYATLEGPSSDTYFCASNKGVKDSNSLPTLVNCCF